MADEKIYDDVIINFPEGAVYYIDRAYVGSKSMSDYEVFNTPYLLGKRYELIVSCNEFNANSQFRWTVPISSVHEDSDTRNGIIFNNFKGEKKILRIDQLRCRHVSDFYFNNGSNYKYSFNDDFMQIVIERITKALPKTDPFLIQMNEYNLQNMVNKLTELEERIKKLESNISNSDVSVVSTSSNHSQSKRTRWTEEEKSRFMSIYRSSIDDAMEKYNMKRNSAISMYYKLNQERRKESTK